MNLILKVLILELLSFFRQVLINSTKFISYYNGVEEGGMGDR